MYASLFAGYIYMMSQNFEVIEKEKDEVIVLSLSQFIPEVIEEPIEEEPVVEVIVEPEPEPIVEEIIEPEPEIEEPEPIPEPEVIEKPIVVPEPIVVKKIIKKKPKPKPKKIVKKKRTKKVAKKKRKATKKSSRKKIAKKSRSKKINAKNKKQFLDKIRAKIRSAKSYPRIAKRRGMQGTVKVRFTILRSGRVGNISVIGPKVFHNSAKNTIRKAFPINAKNAPISLPKIVNITLRYQLR